MTNTMNDLLSLQPANKGTLVRDNFSALSGFRWESVDTAHIALDDRTAIVSFDAAGDLRFTVSLDESLDPVIDPVWALRLNHQLPSNLRFALDGQRFQLAADIGSSDSPELLETIVEGARLALAGQAPQQDGADLDKQEVEGLLHSFLQHGDSLVDLEEGWEYRPRVNGQPIAVKINIRGQQLRCQRSVRQLQNQTEIKRTVALEALRTNARVKHARFAAIDSRLVAETCVHRCQLDKEPLSIALRSVAVAENRTHAALVILTNEDHIAAQYNRVLDCLESSSACS